MVVCSFGLQPATANNGSNLEKFGLGSWHAPADRGKTPKKASARQISVWLDHGMPRPNKKLILIPTFRDHPPTGWGGVRREGNTPAPTPIKVQAMAVAHHQQQTTPAVDL
eukprot:EG_transcript_16864